MSFRVEISPSALADALSAFDYIRADAPLAAERWFDGLLKLIDSLETMPRRFGYAREHGRVPGELCQAIHGSHRVIFSVGQAVVQVHAVRHVAQRPLTKRQTKSRVEPNRTA